MLPGQTFKLEDIGRILLRYRWLILLPFAVGLASVDAAISRLVAMAAPTRRLAGTALP